MPAWILSLAILIAACSSPAATPGAETEPPATPFPVAAGGDTQGAELSPVGEGREGIRLAHPTGPQAWADLGALPLRPAVATGDDLGFSAEVRLVDLRRRQAVLRLTFLDAGGRPVMHPSGTADTVPIVADRGGSRTWTVAEVYARPPEGATTMALRLLVEGDGTDALPGSSFAEVRAAKVWSVPSVVAEAPPLVDEGEAVDLNLRPCSGDSGRASPDGLPWIASLVDLHGKEVARHVGPDVGDGISIPSGPLEVGYYEWRWRILDPQGRTLRRGRLPATVLDRDPRPADSPFGVDGALSTYVAEHPGLDLDTVETLARWAHRAGLRHLRDRLVLAEAAPRPPAKEGEAPPLDPEYLRFLAESLERQRSAGLSVTLAFHDLPWWMADPTAGAGGSSASPPADLRPFHRAVTGLAAHLAPSVDGWEIWNEPNIFYFHGRPEEYAALLKAGFLAVRRGDPDAEVLLGALALVTPEWIEGMFDNGIEPYFDVHNWHHYKPAATLPKTFRQQADLLNAHGATPRQWVTETGDRSGGSLEDEALRGALYARRSILAAGAGAERGYVFRLPEYRKTGLEPIGHKGPDLRPRPGLAALAAMTRALGAARPLGRQPDLPKGIEAWWFDPGDGSKGRAAAAWSDAVVPWPESLPRPPRVWDAMGRLRPAPKTLGPFPVYWRGASTQEPEGELSTGAPSNRTGSAEPRPKVKPSSVVLDFRLHPTGDPPADDPRRKKPVPAVPGDALAATYDLYHLGTDDDGPVRLRPLLHLPDGWFAHPPLPAEVALAPGGRRRLDLLLRVGDLPAVTRPVTVVAVAADAGADAPEPTRSSARAILDAERVELEVLRRFDGRNLRRWRLTVPDGDGRLETLPANGDRRPMSATFSLTPDADRRWASFSLALREQDRISEALGLRLRIGPSKGWDGEARIVLRDAENRRRSFAVDIAPPSAGGVAEILALWPDFESKSGGEDPGWPSPPVRFSLLLSAHPLVDDGRFVVETVDLVRPAAPALPRGSTPARRPGME
ncbi:MAG: hypothetical protein AAGD06_12310 [Acidobacteriota bacterium]